MAHAAASVTLVYGILVLLGGAFGYLKAKSKPSLITGGLFGTCLIAAGIAGLRGWARAAEAGVVLSAILLAFFGLRFARRKKLMPAGLLAGLSLVTLLVDVAAVLTSTR